MTYKVALPDLVSNSYFPAIAAVELGFFKNEGISRFRRLLVPCVTESVTLLQAPPTLLFPPSHDGKGHEYSAPYLKECTGFWLYAKT